MGAEARGWGVGTVLDWLIGADAPSEVQSFSEGARRQLAEEVVDALRAGVGRPEAESVYAALERDPRVTGVGATASANRRPEVVVPRENFPSATADPQEEPKRRVTTDVVDLLLIRPVLTADTNRRWGFTTRYGYFGAEIKDTEFLERVAAGTLGVPLTQGIRLRVELEVTEELTDGVWQPINREVIQVLKVIPPPKQQSLGLVEHQEGDPTSDDQERQRPEE